MAGRRWDVFCNVVDNYGDAGVAWRLARILAVEHALNVTLWIDSLDPLAKVAPAIAIDRAMQSVAGVTVRRLTDPLPPFEPADVVVDAFVGGLPDRYIEAMAARSPSPRWFRVEYLALEPEAEAHHGLPSPHPRLPLARTFWFPGFSPSGGGLLRERNLFAARDAFIADAQAQRELWRSLGVPVPVPGETRASMFCYPDAPLEPLLVAWSASRAPITCVVAEGVATAALGRFAKGAIPKPYGAPLVVAQLALAVVPFVAQDIYDRLLWACDVNFVRGEDSFVRAQWAAKPFVWHAYAQAEQAHAAKIAAFLERYTSGLDAPAADAARALFGAWNALPGAPAIERAWRSYETAFAALREHGQQWCLTVSKLPELAATLVKAAANLL
jgi:uncharacterized repeat protein (TIGR03837 family)